MPHATQRELEEALFADGVSTRGGDVSFSSGRGVGLSAVRDLVRSLGGGMEIRSELGHGTTFRFVLPTTMLFSASDRPSLAA